MDLPVLNSGTDPDLTVKRILHPVLLDVDVPLKPLHLIPHRDFRVIIGDRIAQDEGQRIDSIADVILLPVDRHPVDGIQRIVKKMRSYLILKHRKPVVCEHKILIAELFILLYIQEAVHKDKGDHRRRRHIVYIEPEKAQRALDDFTESLRLNVASLTEVHLIPFEDELRHIKTFVALSELRFPGRIEMVYDLEITDFYIPPLSIQPLVENAVKHGILKKMKGGRVTIKAFERDAHFVVQVIDNGVGFDMDQIDFESNKHFGLQNISYRISKISGGKLTVELKAEFEAVAVHLK